jgi:hypothetical protein
MKTVDVVKDERAEDQDDDEGEGGGHF